MAADWVTISSLATAGGTLILAVATFSSTRSANRSARVAERALLAGLRPLLVSSRLDDAVQKVSFMDSKWFKVEGGHAIVEISDDAIYLVISVRNVGAGMAVMHGWRLLPPSAANPSTTSLASPSDGELRAFHRLTRDLYVPPGEIGFWQGALRDPSAPEFDTARALLTGPDRILIELLYGDHEGGQRVVTLFSLVRREDGTFLGTTARHWNLDRADPR
jgi:hypothetical protein